MIHVRNSLARPTLRTFGGLLATCACMLGGCPADKAKSTAPADAAADGGLDGGLDGGVGCEDDARGQTYMPGMSQMGKLSTLKFELVTSDPGPPVKGNNSWLVKISDPSGNAVTGATLRVTPFMPDHGHGTAVKAKISESAKGYTVTPLYLFMGGIWQVTIDATTDKLSDSTVFSFCIGG